MGMHLNTHLPRYFDASMSDHRLQYVGEPLRGVSPMPVSPKLPHPLEREMKHEFTAIIERDGEWCVTYSPEIPGANGQGKSKQDALNSLADAITLILEDRLRDGLRGVPEDAERETVTLE